jgi:hypothetical protein
MTSHGFVLLMCGPSAAMLVPPAPQCQTAKNHYRSNPNIGSHHFNTFTQLSLNLGMAVLALLRDSVRESGHSTGVNHYLPLDSHYVCAPVQN